MSGDRGTDAEKNSGACSIRERRPEGERMRSPGQNENAIRQADAKLILGGERESVRALCSICDTAMRPR